MASTSLLGILASAVIRRSDLLPAANHRSGLVTRSLLGERTTGEVGVWVHVGVEERETHEQKKNYPTRKG